MGAPTGSFKGQYQSNLSNTKNYWRKTTETNALSNTKKNFQNPYVYQRTNTSQNLIGDPRLSAEERVNEEPASSQAQQRVRSEMKHHRDNSE